MTELHRCERGARCYASERATHDTLVGAPCDRPLCDVCEQAVARTLNDAPALYVQIRGFTLVKAAAVRSEMVTASKGSPMPLNGHALHLGEQLAWLLTTWEEIIRDLAGLTPPVQDGKREGSRVQAAAELLAAHLTAWIGAPATTLATSRWTDDVEQSGVDAAIALLDWRSQVRNLPGLDMQAPKAVRRYSQRCPSCGVRAITHRAGDDLMQCQNCQATQPYLPTLPREADYHLEDA